MTTCRSRREFGEVHALVGENGAGKSTLMSVLAGVYRADAGTLAVNGQIVEFKAPRDAIASGIGMVYQHFRLVDSFTVAENVALGAEETPLRLDLRGAAAKLRQLGKRFGLEINPDARIWQLSVGEQQRVEILRLLHRGARILVFDEPTAVLTPQESASLIATLRAMAAQGFCVIFISHKLNEVLAVADRITVLRRGRSIATQRAASTTRAELAQLMVGRESGGDASHRAPCRPPRHARRASGGIRPRGVERLTAPGPAIGHARGPRGRDSGNRRGGRERPARAGRGVDRIAAGDLRFVSASMASR